MLGLKQFSVCFSISGVTQGTIISYSDDLVIYFDAAESITVILFKDYPVYFAVKHSLSMNKVCISMSADKRVDLFTNGLKFMDQRTLSDIPSGLSFGAGDMLIGLENGDMFSFTMWGEAVSHDEMLLYSSVPICTGLERVLVEWRDVVLSLEIGGEKWSVNESMMSEVIVESDVCKLQGFTDYSPDWEEFDSLLPPVLPDRTVILLEDVAELADSSSSSNYLLPSDTEICFSFNFTEQRARRNFTVSLAVCNPYGFSNINLSINNVELSHPCLHCQTYTHTISNVPLTNNMLCIQDKVISHF